MDSAGARMVALYISQFYAVARKPFQPG